MQPTMAALVATFFLLTFFQVALGANPFQEKSPLWQTWREKKGTDDTDFFVLSNNEKDDENLQNAYDNPVKKPPVDYTKGNPFLRRITETKPFTTEPQLFHLTTSVPESLPVFPLTQPPIADLSSPQISHPNALSGAGNLHTNEIHKIPFYHPSISIPKSNIDAFPQQSLEQRSKKVEPSESLKDDVVPSPTRMNDPPKVVLLKMLEEVKRKKNGSGVETVLDKNEENYNTNTKSIDRIIDKLKRITSKENDNALDDQSLNNKDEESKSGFNKDETSKGNPSSVDAKKTPGKLPPTILILSKQPCTSDKCQERAYNIRRLKLGEMAYYIKDSSLSALYKSYIVNDSNSGRTFRITVRKLTPTSSGNKRSKEESETESLNKRPDAKNVPDLLPLVRSQNERNTAYKDNFISYLKSKGILNNNDIRNILESKLAERKNIKLKTGTPFNGHLNDRSLMVTSPLHDLGPTHEQPSSGFVLEEDNDEKLLGSNVHHGKLSKGFFNADDIIKQTSTLPPSQPKDQNNDSFDVENILGRMTSKMLIKQ